MLLVAELGLRLSTLENGRRWLRRLSWSGPRPRGLEAATAARWVDVAARHHLLAMTCLRRALVLEALLAGFGFEPVLRLGVRRQGGAFEAHAWVELGGAPVSSGGDPAESYAVLLPSTGTV